MPNTKIEFDRYTIRDLETEDAPKLFVLIDSNRNRIDTFLPITAQENRTLEMTGSYIEMKLAEARTRTTFTCVIVEKPTRDFVGFLVIKKLDWDARDCELGYFIDRNHEGQGITSGAIQAVSEYCFSKLKLDRISIVTSPDNIGSVRAAEKSGFTREMIIPDGHTDAEGNMHTVYRYELKK